MRETLCNYFALASAFLPSLLPVHGQQPPLFDTATPFGPPINYRSNVCSRQKLLLNGTIGEVENALKGLELSVGIVDYGDWNDAELFRLNEDGVIPPDYPGLYATLMDELATRAGFTWRNSFGMISSLDSERDGSKTWSDFLEWSVENYDVSVDYWSKSAARINRGILFPQGWYDASIVLAERDVSAGTSSRAKFNCWSFLLPFDIYVWVLIAASIVLTGLMYWFLERLDEDSDARNLSMNPIASIFLSAISFTAHFEFRPNSKAAMLLSWSWTFWALIVGAAYTANLVNFLVARDQPHVFYTSLDQAVRFDTPICVLGYSFQDTYITDRHPDANIIRFQSEDDLYQGLKNDACKVLVTERSIFDSYERNFEANGDCTLKSVAKAEKIVPGGFATTMDSGTYCTSLIAHVIDLHLINMEADGFIEAAWNNHLKRTTDQQCQAVADANRNSDGETTTRLTVQDMGGIFIFHYMLCVVAFLFAFVQYFRSKNWMKKKGESEVDVDDDFFDNDCGDSVNDGRRRSSMWDTGTRRESILTARTGRSEGVTSRSNSIWNSGNMVECIWTKKHENNEDTRNHRPHSASLPAMSAKHIEAPARDAKQLVDVESPFGKLKTHDLALQEEEESISFPETYGCKVDG